jgi:hypothetical protein
MKVDWWKCGECRAIHGPEVEACPCLDEGEQMSKGEREEEAMWAAADRALAEMENR